MNEGRSIAGALLVLVMLTLAACAQSPSVTGTTSVPKLYAAAVANGRTDQAARLEDGKVTRDELNDSLDDFAECLTAEGLTYEFKATNPVDGWRPIFDVFWPDDMDWEQGKDIAAECDHSTWLPVSWGYELTNPAVMEPEFTAKLAECLTSKGIVPTGDETNLSDFIPLGVDDPQEAVVVECANAVGAAYPYGIMLAY